MHGTEKKKCRDNRKLISWVTNPSLGLGMGGLTKSLLLDPPPPAAFKSWSLAGKPPAPPSLSTSFRAKMEVLGHCILKAQHAAYSLQVLST